MKNAILLIVLFCSLPAFAKTAHIYDLKTGDVSELKCTCWGQHGKIHGQLKSGEKLQGEYSVAVNAAIGWGSVYSSVYGGANTTSMAVGGQSQGSLILTGEQGTILTCEFISGGGHGSGACKDNHDNLYKLMF